jgi:hypothetical protein
MTKKPLFSTVGGYFYRQAVHLSRFATAWQV